jgi:hypothetical protein
MFSARLPFDLEPSLLAASLEEKRNRGLPLLDLTVSNPTTVGLKSFDEEDLRLLSDPAAILYDPQPAGSFSARQAVSGYYADQGVHVDPEQILLTASTSEAYAHLFQLLGGPGDAFLAPVPSYPLFGPLGALEAVRVTHYPLRYDGRWWLDLEALKAGVARGCRGIIALNPNNPTGSFLSRVECEAVESIAFEGEIPLIVDEVFADFARDSADRRRTFAGGGPALTFVLSGLSKVAGLPQLKLGWIVVSGPEDLRRQAVRRLEWITDLYLSVGTPVQIALPELLRKRHRFQSAISERKSRNMTCLTDRVSGSPLEVLDSQGGWTAVLRVPRHKSEEEWCLELLRRDVVVHPGYFYDFPDEAYLVVSLIVDPEVFDGGILRLVELSRDWAR